MTVVPFISPSDYLKQQHRHGAARLWNLVDSVKRRLTFLQHSLLVQRLTLMTVMVGGETVLLRPGTPDFIVANECLCGEFDEVVEAAGDIGNGLVVDAGGYIGTAAIAFARAYPRATVVTLEPSRANFAVLKRNTAKWPNIIALNKAIGPEPGTIELRNPGSMEWGFTVVANPLSGATTVLHEVEVVTISDVLAKVGRSKIDICKIDIEGAEQALFSRNTDWIGKTRVVCAELHDRIEPGCTATFEAATSGRRNRQLDGEKIMSVA